MNRADHDFRASRALIIDGHPMSRSILAAQLRELGVGVVLQCGRIADARRHLEGSNFDLVLCEQHFHDGGTSGQTLLNDLRQAQLLPFSTVFVMVTGEASYAAVADAAESALDSYLLKPFAATSLAERLVQARRRKRLLSDIFKAIEAGEFDQAARLCLARFHHKAPYWLYAARIGAELLLRLDRHDEAHTLYQAVIEAKALPWAKLGIARAQLAGGKLQQAQKTLDVLIAADPGYADAYDVMGRVHVEQGTLDEALKTYRMATQLTPSSVQRLQRQGMLAFYLGEKAEAKRSLERAAHLGVGSQLLDQQCVLLLAFTRLRDRDAKGLQRCHDQLLRVWERDTRQRRIQRFAEVAEVLTLLLDRQVPKVLDKLVAMAAEIRTPEFDLEAALNLITLLAELNASEVQVPNAQAWIETLALRFGTTKNLTELMAHAAQRCETHMEVIRSAHTKITALAEAAINHSLNGKPRAAVIALLEHGAITQNTKLIDMARGVLQRHAQKIDDVQGLLDRADALLAPLTASTRPPLAGQGIRQTGGLALRVGAMAANPDPAPGAPQAS